MNYPTRFDGLLDLARLPWFEERGGRLVLAERALVGEGAIDVHTHLALAYGAPPRVDLRREWPETEHYLPKERAVDFEVSQTLERAVRSAAEQARAGEAVVLSPACASFDQFRNFMHRGQVFQELVRNLIGGPHGEEARL